MAELREFSKIVIVRDTPDVRWALGYPLEGTYYNNTNFGANMDNPFYKKLLDSTSGGNGWRSFYPNFDNVLLPGNLSDGNNEGIWKRFIRPNILNPIDTEQNDNIGYEQAIVSSGTGIIVGDKFYVGNNQTVSYSSIISSSTGDGDVTVSGNFNGVANGTKVILSTIGTTGLSTSTVYYVYNATGSTCKLSNNSSSYVEIDGLDGSAGSGTAYLAPATFDYVLPTTFVNPSLAVKDYLFWGDDPNSLNIGGKIKKVYTPSDSEYADGARYQFEKSTIVAFPVYTEGGFEDQPIPQDIYYFRNSWPNKDIKNGYGDGFYVLIKLAQDSSGVYNVYPYLNCAGAPNSDNNSTNSITNPNSTFKTAYEDLIRIRRISNKFKSDETDTGPQEEIIPCSIHRTNGFFYTDNDYDANRNLKGLFNNNTSFSVDITPQWCAYYINPYGNSGSKLDKNSTYVIEISERLPAVIFGNIQEMFPAAIGGAI